MAVGTSNAQLTVCGWICLGVAGLTILCAAAALLVLMAVK